MAKVNRSEAEAISSDNETPVTTKRRRIEQESIKDEMDFDQQKNKKETIYAGMMTRSRSRRARYDGVSEFIVGTCQMFSESNVIEPTDIRDLIISERANQSISILCGSCAEFFIQPLRSCIGDTDMFTTNLYCRAFKDENFAHSYQDVHYFCDSIGCFVIKPYDDYPSFVQLREFGETTYNWESRTFDFIRNYDGQLFTNQDLIVDKPLDLELIEVGPAMRAFQSSDDYVPSIWCPQWPNEAKDWPLRRREHGWPTTAIIHKVVQTGCHLVFVTHPDCRDDVHQFRLSFSIAEVILIQSWTKVQQIVYHMLRFFAKNELIQKDCPKEDEVLCTYHFKTLMLWSCEENSPEWWSSCSVVEICSNLLEVLARWLKEKICRNYFVSRANLFRKHINQAKVNESYKKLFKLSRFDVLFRWFAIQYIQPVLRDVPKGSELFQNALCLTDKLFGEHYMQLNVPGVISERHIHKAICTEGVFSCFNRCLIATLAAMKANIPKSIDINISALFGSSSTWAHEQEQNIRNHDHLMNSRYHRILVTIRLIKKQFMQCAGIDSCLWFYESMLRMLHASSLLECKVMQFDSEWFVEQLILISNKPNIIVSKHHILRRPLRTAVNESQLCFIKALYLMENLNGSTDDIEFQVLSEVSKRLLWKSLSCENSERDTMAALSYLVALHFAKAEYQTVLDICSTVILNRKIEEQETETLHAGWLLYVEDISMIIGFHFIFIKLKDASLQYCRILFSLDPRLTSDIFVNYLEISAIERISSIERAGKVLRPNNISKEPTFPIDAILMKITNRKSSQLSQKGFTLLPPNKITNRLNLLHVVASNKCRLDLANDNYLIQLLLTFSLQNMTSCYNAICKKVGIDFNVVDCYRAAYLYMCCRYCEMLDLCDKILHEPDQLESLREIRFANVTVLPPLYSFFDNDIKCVVGLHTLAYYLSPLNDVLQKREVYTTSTFQHFFARWAIAEKRMLPEFIWHIPAYRHYVLGRHFLARYLKVRLRIETGCYLDALLELEKLKSNLPFESIMDVFLRKKLRRLNPFTVE